uniref:3-hydroxyacyl-ACP dehydratase FabZ family protein n=1 Tax=Flavobacterium sp. TaxID=239 RepID=UPI0040493AE1
MQSEEIIRLLPYQNPFLFVDEISYVDENKIVGNFTFDENLNFYQGHFKNNPITPGVILIETMAQIGLASFGIYLSRNDLKPMNIAFTASNVDFLKPVFPKEKVVVTAEKVYFRFGKLRCQIQMTNSDNHVVCKGILDGMLIQNKIADAK